MGVSIVSPLAAAAAPSAVPEQREIASVEDWCSATSGLTPEALKASKLPNWSHIQATDRLLLCGDPRHWRTAALCAVANDIGAQAMVLEPFCPLTALRLLDTEQITVSDWLPWQLGAVLDLPAEIRDGYGGRTHGQAWTGGARIPQPYKHRLIQWWGPMLHEHFSGLSWAGCCSIDSADWLERPGSVGRWVAAESSQPPPDCPAMLVVLNESDELGAKRQPEQIGRLAAEREDASLQPIGQVGYIDEDGWVYPLGRPDNRLEIAFGRNEGKREGKSELGLVAPGEAERWLETHPSVAEAALLAVGPELAEPLGMAACFYAVVQLNIDAPPATPLLELELLDFARAGLSDIKCPIGVLFEAVLPRRPNGQVDLVELGVLVQQSVATAPPELN